MNRAELIVRRAIRRARYAGNGIFGSAPSASVMALNLTDRGTPPGA